MFDRVGQQIGNYHLVRILGTGGFGEVYLGKHIHLETFAAIKVLRVNISKNERELLLNEARMTAQLVHPNIIQVLDFVQEIDGSYFIMTYAPGGNLRSHFPWRNSIPLQIITPFVKQLTSALQYIHDNNIIHRDLKPENMLLGRHNEILLGDFGISVREEDQEKYRIVGTPLYMAPEAFQGHAGRASDQYSLAVTIYEWLSGQPLFRGGSSIEYVFLHRTETPRPLRTFLPNLTPTIDNVILTALAKKPEQRFSTIEAFGRAFEQACQTDPSLLPRIFVSHSSVDNQFGAKLAQELREAIGNEDAVWYDASGGLQGGDVWWSKIKEELKARSTFLVVLSPDALKSRWVHDEINMAWRQKNSPQGKRIVPILYRDCEIPDDLDTLQVISFLQPKPYQIALNELLKALGLPVFQ